MQHHLATDEMCNHPLRRRPVDHIAAWRAFNQVPHHAQHTTMRHHHRMLGNLTCTIEQPRRHIVIILAAFGAELPIAFFALTRRPRIFAVNFRVLPPFEITE